MKKKPSGYWTNLLRNASVGETFWIEQISEATDKNLLLTAERLGMEIKVQRWTAMYLAERVLMHSIPSQRLVKVTVIRGAASRAG